MNSFWLTSLFVVTSLTAVRAESTVTVQPINYTKLQREMRWNAQQAAEQAETMARLARRDHTSAASQRMGAADLKKRVNAALDRAVQLSISMPYETFDSAEGNRLMQSITKLAAATTEAIEFVNESPTRVQSGEYVALLEKVRDICEELTE